MASLVRPIPWSIVRGHGRQRGDAKTRENLIHVEPQLVQLVKRGLDRAGHHLRGSSQARCRGDQQSEPLRDSGQLGDDRRYGFFRRVLASLSRTPTATSAFSLPGMC